MLQLMFMKLTVNYAGFFTELPGRSYVNGEFAYFDCIVIDEFSIHELNDMPDMSLDNGLYALGNEADVRRFIEYIRLGYKMIKVFIEYDKTTMYTYIDAAYNTPTKKCVIMKIPDGVTPKNAPLSKMKPRRPVSRNCAKKLMLGWKQNDANVIGKSSSRHEDGESSQPNTTTATTQIEFVNDFYSASDPIMGEEEFDPFFGLDSEPVDAKTTRNKCVDKGKRVALDYDQVHVTTDNGLENETENENSDKDSSESDELVDEDNELVDVAVKINYFDRTNAKTMGNEGTLAFNAYEDFDIGIDVIDAEEF
ncbi:hypothetical protein Tco_1347619 [Tanacetum coccineum]